MDLDPDLLEHAVDLLKPADRDQAKCEIVEVLEDASSADGAFTCGSDSEARRELEDLANDIDRMKKKICSLSPKARWAFWVATARIEGRKVIEDSSGSMDGDVVARDALTRLFDLPLKRLAESDETASVPAIAYLGAMIALAKLARETIPSSGGGDANREENMEKRIVAASCLLLFETHRPGEAATGTVTPSADFVDFVSIVYEMAGGAPEPPPHQAMKWAISKVYGGG